MQELAGIIRTESELVQALDELDKLEDRAWRVSVPGGRAYNPGWNLATDLPSMLTVSRLVAKGALERKESRGGHTRDDYPKADPELAKVNFVQRLGSSGALTITPEPMAPMPPELPEASRGGTQLMAEVTMRVWRGDAAGGDFTDYAMPAVEGEVVLDVIHRIQAGPAPDLACRWNCKAGKCGSCSAEINGTPRLMCMTRMDSLPPTSRWSSPPCGPSRSSGTWSRTCPSTSRWPGASRPSPPSPRVPTAPTA